MKRYTLLLIPEDGLFYRNRKFCSGSGAAISNPGYLTTYPTRKAAQARKNYLVENNGPLWKRYIIVEFVETVRGAE